MLTFEVETAGPLLAFDLFGRPKSLALGTRATIPGGAVLTLQDMREQRSVDLSTVVRFGVEFGRDVAVIVVASWLYDRLKDRARSLRIDRIDVQIAKGEIERILIERLERKE